LGNPRFPEVKTPGKEKSMKRLFLTVNLFILMLVVFCGTGHALSVTVLKGGVPDFSIPAVSGKEPIILTFADEHVVIHDSTLRVPGRLVSPREVSLSELFLLRDHRSVSYGTGYERIYSQRGFHLAIVPSPQQLAAEKRVNLMPVTASMVVVEVSKRVKRKPDPKVVELLKKLDRTEYGKSMSALSAAPDMSTRYSCADEALTARDRISAYFEELGLEVSSSMEFANTQCAANCKSQRRGYNVIAKKTGTKRPDEFYLVGAHYDSINEYDGSPCESARGACDNASGVAGVMELARVFSQIETEASVVFVAFGGEEIDILGSSKYVQELVDNQEISNLKAFVVLDMVSYYDKKRGVFIEGSKKESDQKARALKFKEYFDTYTDIKRTEILWPELGYSDHRYFLAKGIPGALLIQMECTKDEEGFKYPYIHSSQDLIKYQDLPFALEIVKVAAATLAEAGL
jgi:hypothetical protein